MDFFYLDSLGKEPISVTPTSIENTLNKQQTIGITTSSKEVPTAENTMQQTTVEVLPHAVTMATAIPLSSMTIQRLPSSVTMATTHFGMTMSNSTVISNLPVEMPVISKTNVISTQNLATTNTAVSNNDTTVPDLVTTSSAIPMTSSELLTNVTETMTSPLAMESRLAVTSRPQNFPMSYDPTTSSTILMPSPDENETSLRASHLQRISQSVASIDQSSKTTAVNADDVPDFTYTSSKSQPTIEGSTEMQAT
jgi:hypothetical protein